MKFGTWWSLRTHWKLHCPTCSLVGKEAPLQVCWLMFEDFGPTTIGKIFFKMKRNLLMQLRKKSKLVVLTWSQHNGSTYGKQAFSWSLYLIRQLYLNGVWLSDGSTNAKRSIMCSKEIGLLAQHMIIILAQFVNIFGGWTYMIIWCPQELSLW